jgi:DNA-binding transcriptional regulator GbsR (MarR family)
MRRFEMKLPIVLLLASMLVFSGAAAAHDRDRDCGDHHDHGFLRNCDVDWDEDEGLLSITNEDDDDEVIEITKKYVLTINGERIELDRRQKGLVKEYYKNFKQLHELAAEIGEEGARLGVKGSKIAVVALKNLCKLLGDDDDAEEFEEEIEREAEKIEAEAEKLEVKAEKLEDVVDDLEKLHHDLKKAVPELDNLNWF